VSEIDSDAIRLAGVRMIARARDLVARMRGPVVVLWGSGGGRNPAQQLARFRYGFTIGPDDHIELNDQIFLVQTVYHCVERNELEVTVQVAADD